MLLSLSKIDKNLGLCLQKQVKICRNIKCALHFIIISVPASEGLEEPFEFVEHALMFLFHRVMTIVYKCSSSCIFETWR